MASINQRTDVDIDSAARQRLSNFRFRFGSSPTNSNIPMELDSPSSNARDISPNMTPTGTPTATMSKSHGRLPSHHSRSHSRTGSFSTTFTFPLKPSTMNNLPPPANTTSNQSPSANDSPGQQAPFGFIPSGTTTRSRPNSHHKRRSSVSTRRESAEIMGVSAPEAESDTIMDGRRMALWALEGKGKTTTTRRPDFISGYTQVEIPELGEAAWNFGNGDENEPPTWPSSESKGFSSFNHNSFPPPLALNSSSMTKRDAVNTGLTSSSGKRDTYPFFGPGSTNSASKRDSYSNGFGIGMMSSVGKRDSFGKFLNACAVSDQLGTLLEEEEDVEEEEEGEKEEEECDDDEEAQQADETLRAPDEIETEGQEVEEHEDEDEILLEMNHQLNEEPLSHVPSRPQSSPPSCFSPAASPLSALVSTPTPTSISTPAPIPTSVTMTPLQPPIFNSASTTDNISVTTIPMAPPTTTIPVVDSLSPFVSSPNPPASIAPAPTSTAVTPRPRPANLNLNVALRPLSLTPDSLPLNTRAASISPLASSSMNDASTSTPISGVAGSASSRVPGLRPLSLVAAVSMSSPAGLAPSTSQSQASVTRRMSLISSSLSHSHSNMSGSFSSSSSVSYRRSSMSIESDSSPAFPNEPPSRPGPLYQYATTLRRTSQSHLPTPGATPTSAVSPLHSGLPFGMSMMREEEECGDEDEDETVNNNNELCVEKDADGDASTPTGPASITAAPGVGAGKLAIHSTLHRPLSPTEQAFLYRSHTSLLCRISELEEIIAKNQQQHMAGSEQHRLRSRGRSGALSPSGNSDVSSSSYGRRHGRFESSISSVSTNTSIDSAAVSSSSSSSTQSVTEPSDELLQLITDLKAERDSLMRDVQTYQERVAELEKTIATLTRRVETERRESWVAQERMSVLEIERRRAAEEVSRLKDVVRDLHRAENAEVERVRTELRLEKERISRLEVQVEDVRRELDAEKVKTRQAEDEASMLRVKVEEMSREMDALRNLVAEQHAQILRFRQVQMQTKRVAPKVFNNSFASTSTSTSTSTSASTGSCSLSFSNSHSHMSSSSSLAVDETEADDGEGDDDDDAGRFKYVPFGMSPPRSHSGATLGSVAETEEEAGDVPSDITADENGDEDGDETEDDNNELAHYEDTGEFDGDLLGNEEEEEDVTWGEDATTSSFGDFVPRQNVPSSLNTTPTLTPVSSPTAPSGFRRGHARVGSMEKGWSFATARVNAVQAQTQNLARDAIDSNCGSNTEADDKAPKVDRFFDCLNDLEDDQDSGTMTNLDFPDSKSLWSGMVKRSENAGDDEGGMDLPPFLLPASMDANSSASSCSSLILDTIEEEEEEEDEEEGFSEYLATPDQTPNWKDLIDAKLNVLAEEDDETVNEEDDDECPPSPSLRPSFYAQRNSHIQSFLPRPVCLVPPTSVLSQMTPNTLKTTLDATVRSPPSAGSQNNSRSIGASLGLSISNSTATATTTPVKTRYSLSPSTHVSVSSSGNVLLPTPPPTLIPRLASKSGLSSSPISPSPISVSPSPALSSSSSSPVSSDFAEREREIGLSTPTPRSPLIRYGPLSPSRIPTPSKKNIGSPTATITAGSVTDCFADYVHTESITYPTSGISHQGETASSGSGIDGKDRGSDQGGVRGGGDGSVGSCYSSSRSKLWLSLGDTRSPSAGTVRLQPDHSLDLDSIDAARSSSSGNTTFGGFTTRLTRYLRSGGGESAALGDPPFLSRTRFRPVFVNREKQVKLLRARLRGQNESQGRCCTGRRMKDEDVRFVGCSNCADSNIIVL